MGNSWDGSAHAQNLQNAQTQGQFGSLLTQAGDIYRIASPFHGLGGLLSQQAAQVAQQVQTAREQSQNRIAAQLNGTNWIDTNNNNEPGTSIHLMPSTYPVTDTANKTLVFGDREAVVYQKEKESVKMTGTGMFSDLKAYIAKYRDVVYTVVFVAIVDQMVFKGALRTRLVSVFEKLLDRVENAVTTTTSAEPTKQ